MGGQNKQRGKDEWTAQRQRSGDSLQVGSRGPPGVTWWLTGIGSQARKLGNKEVGPGQSRKKGL